jgi:hypothetical protein
LTTVRGEEPFERRTREMYEMLDPQAFRQRREEMLREAKSSRAGTLPADRNRRRDLTLAWELERVAGRLLKPLRRSQEISRQVVTSGGIERARRNKYG